MHAPNGSFKDVNGNLEEKLDEHCKLMGKVEGDSLKIVGVGTAFEIKPS